MLVAVTGPALLGVVGSLLFPGVGQGLAAHRLRGVAWAIAAVASTWLILVSVWFLAVTLVVRVASAVDAYVCLKRHTPPNNYVSMAIALVIGAVGIGGAQATIEAFKIPSSSMYPTLFIGDHVYIDKLSLAWRPVERGEIIVFDQPCAKRVYIKRVVALAGDTVEVRCNKLYLNGTAVKVETIDPNTSYQDFDESRDEWSARRVARYRQTLGTHTFDIFQQIPTSADAPVFGDFPQRDRPFAPSCSQGGGDFYPDRPVDAKQPQGTLVSTRELAQASVCDTQLHFVVPKGGIFVMGDNRGNANDSRYWGVVPTGNVIGRLIGIYLSDGLEGGWGRVGAVE